MPESFENFAFCCKIVYEAGEFLPEKHNTLSRYRNFGYTKLQDPNMANILSDDFYSSSLELLSRITDEPLTARNIVSADFKNDATTY